MDLYKELTAYCASDAYPFHMPGHKRRTGSMQDPYSIDITEIDGFDDLHHPSGLLKEAEQRAAGLYQSSETHFLVNGSTGGILSAITALVPPGGLLLMARNSHRSAYHAAGLRNIQVKYLYPSDAGQLNGPVTPQEVLRVLSMPGCAEPDAIFLTSPTYDGVVSDVASIAQIAHERGIPLIIDEAHGAHFGMHPAFPPSSVTLGADVVIHSLHKTLPSLTQTALIHINGSLADRKKLRSMLSVFQTSSPSYVLMASIDSCIRFLAAHKTEYFDTYIRLLTRFREQAHFSGIRLLQTDDPSRILLQSENMTARKLYDTLRLRYHLQPEMAAVSYVLLLSSASDDEEGFSRLLEALRQLDSIPAENGVSAGYPQVSYTPADRPVIRTSVWQAVNAPQETVPFDTAAGSVCAGCLYLYPPGVPLLAPGEEITPSVIRHVRELAAAGYELHGTGDCTQDTVRIIKEEAHRL